ncbi:MAG: single-stranded DNA-binding protein [Acholeplasmatales bacterium]|jgi:single-stranded DNA-binding protein|nr:single-stranded DNA-binding protein [Acholeplasmatales bacterium]
MNKVEVDGRLTADPEVKVLESGTKRVSFTLAVARATEKYPDLKPSFIPVVLWGEEASKFGGTKGDLVYVSGELITDSWVKDDKHYSSFNIKGFKAEIKTKKKEASYEASNSR